MNAMGDPDDPTARRRCRAWIWWAAAALVTIWLLWMTQRPQDAVSADLEVLTKPASSRGISSRLLIGILGNVAVFVPLGAAVAQALAYGDGRAAPSSNPGGRPITSRSDASPERGSCGRTAGWLVVGGTGAGTLLSGLIELLQRAQPSRVADWEDVLLNTLGALVGALTVAGWHRWLTRSEGAVNDDDGDRKRG